MSNPFKGTPPPIQWTMKDDGKLYPPTIEQIQAYQEWYEAQDFPPGEQQPMTLREQIAEIIGTIEYAELYPDKGAEKIIALVREAMLSEDVVQIANQYLPRYDLDSNAEDVITAALDAITTVPHP